MSKKEKLTFIFLLINFLVTGMVIQRPAVLENDLVFGVIIIAAAYGLTKYVFYVSEKLK